MITTEYMTYSTWCERSPRHGVGYMGFCLSRSPGLMGDDRNEQGELA